MYLAQFRAENFRQFERLSLQPHSRLNLVLGANAAGKTSFLEAIYCLGRAKSFRSSSLSELAGNQKRNWAVAGDIAEPDRPLRNVQISWAAEGSQIQLDATAAGTLDLVRNIPIQIMEPGMHRLLQDGPGYRRSFLDWGVFHVEQQFLPAWRRFQRALKQRNHALRRHAATREINAWNPELADSAQVVQNMREAHVEQIRQLLGAYIEGLLGIQEWHLELIQGWSAEHAYREVLEREIERDRRQGMTVEGPHRAEMRIKLQGRQVKNRISRGQQKLLICALILIQARLIQRHSQRVPILLLDDFSAELAVDFQAALLQEMLNYPGQVFLSAFERQGPLLQALDAAVFHVEQGHIQAA